MLKQNWRLISRLERAGDFLIIIASFFGAYYGRTALVYWNDVLLWNLPFTGDELLPLKDNFIVLFVGIIGFAVLLSAFGAYSSMRLRSIGGLIRVASLSSVLVFFGMASVLFVLKIDLSRSFLALFCSLSFIGILAQRYLVLRLLRYYRRRGRNYRNVIICGIGEQAIHIAKEIYRLPELGIKIRGFAQLKEEGSFELSVIEDFRAQLIKSGLSRAPRVLIGQHELIRVIESTAIDEVIFSDVLEVMPLVQDIILACSEKGVRTTVVADLFSVGLVQSGISYFGHTPLIHFQTPPGDRWELVVKRLIDIAVSSLLLVMLSPLLILISALVAFSSAGPVIYVQRRVGLNGRLFHMYKFRSMYLDSHRQLQDLREKNEMDGPVFKMKDDPRITPIGRFLRRFSLDELPQLWNVLVGDMSLVGPRPPVPGEVSLYERKNRRRLSMRPGLTCTWQVSGRNEIKDFSHWVKLDLEYIDNWSLWRDLSLLLRTVPAVLLGTGAR